VKFEKKASAQKKTCYKHRAILRNKKGRKEESEINGTIIS